MKRQRLNPRLVFSRWGMICSLGYAAGNAAQEGVQIYYAVWQIGALFKARQIHRKHQFDLVHHLTFDVFRTPGLMWGLGVPFAFGAVGGGEFTPHPLARHFCLRARCRGHGKYPDSLGRKPILARADARAMLSLLERA
jgi:hypothetical protein